MRIVDLWTFSYGQDEVWLLGFIQQVMKSNEAFTWLLRSLRLLHLEV